MKKKFIILMLILSLGLGGCISLNGNLNSTHGSIYLGNLLSANPHISANINIR